VHRPGGEGLCRAVPGDIIIPIREGAYSADRIYGELGELVTGKKPGRESDAETTLFKSVGLSIQDISAAHLVYQKARERGIGTEFEFYSPSARAGGEISLTGQRRFARLR